MKMIYQSFLATDMERFLTLKQTLGFNRNSYDYKLYNLDWFIRNTHPELAVLKKNTILEWVEKRPDENNNGRLARLYAVNEFLKYLVSIGKGSYIIPKEVFDKRLHFNPYLFTDEELTKFFHAVDTIHNSPWSYDRERVLPVLLRMIYCCALRPGEPLRLLCKDVNLEKGTLFIRQSKRHKDRIIWMSKDLWHLCERYNSIMGERSYFFTAKETKPFQISWLHCQFDLCLKNSGMDHEVQKIRPYDLRHAACSRVILKWLNEGKDFYNLVCCLREHMGHSSFTHTMYYIHMLPENLIKSAGIDWHLFDHLYPEDLREVTDEKA